MNVADEIARLANIALAEVGHPECIYAKPTDEFPTKVTRKVRYVNATTYKAIKLARLHVLGPDWMTLCPAHPSHSRGGERCLRVPVREALMGRTCGVT